MNRIKSSALFISLAAFLGMFACASKPVEPETSQSANAKPESGPPSDDHAHRGPPEEAFTACADKSEGAECTVKIENETLTGTCRKGPPNGNDQRLICLPQGGPGGHRGPGAPH